MAESQNALTVRTTLTPWVHTCRQVAEFMEGEAERDAAALTFSEFEAAFIATQEVRDMVDKVQMSLFRMKIRHIPTKPFDITAVV